MKAGRIIGEGVKGITMDMGCKPYDPDTFCNMIKKKNTKGLNLFSESSTHYVPKERVHRFLEHVSKKHSYVVKVFKPSGMLIPFLDRTSSNFSNELKGMKRVFKMFSGSASKYTTLKKQTFDGHNFIAVQMLFENETPMYATFSKKCNHEIKDHRFEGYTEFNAFVRHTLETLAVLQKNGYAHCDIKTSNMVYCNDEKRFKLIDWEMSKRLSWSKNHMYFANISSDSPLALYMYGIPETLAINSFRVANYKDRSRWYDSMEAQDLIGPYINNLSSVIEGRTNEGLFRKYKNHLDMFAACLVYSETMFNNNLKQDRYLPFFSKMISLSKDRFEDASAALKEFNRSFSKKR